MLSCFFSVYLHTKAQKVEIESGVF